MGHNELEGLFLSSDVIRETVNIGAGNAATARHSSVSCDHGCS